MLSTSFLLAASMVVGQADEVGPHFEHLKDLEYFVGDWRINGKVETDFEPLAELTEGPLRLVFSYDWMDKKSFLTLDIREKPKSPVQYHAAIGWDPVRKQIRSRDFNSAGAWFEYVHVKTEKGWIVEGESVYPGGTKGTFRGEITIIDKDAFGYEGAGVMFHEGQEIDVSLKYKATRRQRRSQ
jgi:hypothetical protein